MLVFIGVFIGALLGLTGAGGSVFAVPLLLLVAGFSLPQATALSLGTVALSCAYGTLRNGYKGNVLWRPAFILAVCGMATAPLGQWLAGQMPPVWLQWGFSALALVIALRMWLSAQRRPEDTQWVRASMPGSTEAVAWMCRFSTSGRFELRPKCVGALVAGGAGVGLLSGMFGVGGGFLIVPLLLALSPISMTHAIGASLFIITLVSGVAFASYALQGHLPAWPFLAQVVAGGIAGMLLGQISSRYLAGPVLQKAFAVALVMTSVVLVVSP